MDKFDSDGKKKDFKLAQKPLRPLISVESPAGILKNETDDYTVNYEGGVIFFRTPLDKGKVNVLIKYHTAQATGEVRNLKFILTFSLTVWANDLSEINRITLEAIKVLYRERANLAKRGINEIRLIKGYSAEAAEKKKVSIIEYQIESTIKIEIPAPPIEKIEIGKKEE